MNRVGNHRSWLCYAGSLLAYSKEEEEEEEGLREEIKKMPDFLHLFT